MTGRCIRRAPESTRFNAAFGEHLTVFRAAGEGEFGWRGTGDQSLSFVEQFPELLSEEGCGDRALLKVGVR